jgi:methyltransferase
VKPYLLLLALVGMERLVELALSRKNAASTLARGGIEYGAGHFFWMALLHGAFLVAPAGEVLLLDRPFIPALGYPMLALVAGAQALRYWVIGTLGDRWNVRIIVVPGAPVVTSGPYRILRHPNYLAVVVEMVALPLTHTAYLTASLFSVLNAVVLRIRVRVEEDALARHGDYRERLGQRPRLLPGWSPIDDR